MALIAKSTPAGEEEQPGAPCSTPHPRLLRDVVCLPVDDGVIIDGLSRCEVIRGPVAQTILPKILTLLDGRHSQKDILAAFPAIAPDYVQGALAQLRQWGLIEHPDDQADCPAPAQMLSYFRRRIAASHLGMSACQAVNCLSRLPIVIAAELEMEQLAPLLQRVLQSSGFPAVELARSVDEITFGGPVAAVLLSTSTPGLQTLEKLERRRINEPAFRWLHARLGRSTADIGPLFHQSATCYQCFQSMHGFSADRHTGPVEPETAMYWLGLISMELTVLAGLSPLGLSGREFRRFALPNWEGSDVVYVRRPGCAVCWPDSSMVSHPAAIETSFVFEQSVALETRKPVFRAGLAFDHTSPDARPFANCERLPLAPVEARMNASALDILHTQGHRRHGPRGARWFGWQERKRDKAEGCAVSKDKLSALLALVAGIRERSGRTVRRWQATAGNLGSVDLYIVVRAADGIEPGFYYYDAEEHNLAAFRRRNASKTDPFMRRVLAQPSGDLPEVLIVFVGVFHRLERKYGAFSQRLIYLDAGSALAQLHLVARALDLDATTIDFCADDVIEHELNLVGPGEQVTVIAALGQSPNVTRANAHTGQRPAAMLASFRSFMPQQIAHQFFRESRVYESELHAPVQEAEVGPGDSVDVPEIALPRPFNGRQSVAGVVVSRRSVRAFDCRKAPLRAIATMLFVSASGDAADWPGPRTPPLSLYLLARGVDQLEPGVYVYRPDSHSLALAGGELRPSEWHELFVQDDWSDAAFAIWIAGDLAAACRKDGTPGHRQSLLRAGAACQRSWFAALALGLSGSLVAGLVPGAARRLLGLDGYRRASLLAFLGGYAV